MVSLAELHELVEAADADVVVFDNDLSPAQARNLEKALGVKVANLAQLTGVHRNTLRNPSSERLQGRMREMVKVISAATELTGDVDKAIYWYRNEPIADYGHRTAAELVADGKVEAVLAFIRDLENGARG